MSSRLICSLRHRPESGQNECRSTPLSMMRWPLTKRPGITHAGAWVTHFNGAKAEFLADGMDDCGPNTEAHFELIKVRRLRGPPPRIANFSGKPYWRWTQRQRRRAGKGVSDRLPLGIEQLRLQARGCAAVSRVSPRYTSAVRVPSAWALIATRSMLSCGTASRYTPAEKFRRSSSSHHAAISAAFTDAFG